MSPVTLIQVLYKASHGCRKLSMEQIAERLGLKQPWSLYKMFDPSQDGYRFPAEWLIPFMQATGDYSPLHYIARQCGFVCIKYARFKLGKQNLGKLAETFGMASAAIHRMYEENIIDQAGYELIYALLQEVAGHLKVAERARSGQAEMEF
jgi:hypothetical protein